MPGIVGIANPEPGGLTSMLHGPLDHARCETWKEVLAARKEIVIAWFLTPVVSALSPLNSIRCCHIICRCIEGENSRFKKILYLEKPVLLVK